VRDALLSIQRRLGSEGGVVMDGRDIGTVIFPGAELKIFLDASLDERARRRHAEMLERGVQADYDKVRADIAARDKQDSEREVAPLKPATDAVLLDSTQLTSREVTAKIIEMARVRGA
jgi:cytidylate kinase